MKQQITRLLLLLGAFHLLPTALCECYKGSNFNGRHHTGPCENNVFWHQLGPPPPEQLETTRPTSTPSPGGVTAGTSTPAPAPSTDEVCLTNQDGFGGAIGTDIFTVQYSYELELTPNRSDSLENILFKLERSIADMILETTDFRNVPCDGRRLVEHPVDSSTNTRGKRRRKLAPVGLSINPRDQLNDQLNCETSTPNVCQLIDGAFQVYTVGDSAADEKLPTILLEKLKVAMNNGKFDDVHPAIIRVTYVDINSIGGTDQLNNGNEPDRVRANVQDQGPNSGLIIGASVAALFVLGALVFYRRRRMSKNDEDELGDMPAGSVNSNVI